MIRTLLSLGALLTLSGSVLGQTSPSKGPSGGLPVYDHIVIVVEENKYYDQVIANASAPYINQVLREEGANLTHMYAEEHESEGNYFWLFSGSNQGVGFQDGIPGKRTHKIYPFRTSNLGQQSIEKKLTFKGYSEDLPKTGSSESALFVIPVNNCTRCASRVIPNHLLADTKTRLGHFLEMKFRYT